MSFNKLINKIVLNNEIKLLRIPYRELEKCTEKN